MFGSGLMGPVSVANAQFALPGISSGTVAIPNRKDGVRGAWVLIANTHATSAFYYRPVLSGGSVAASTGALLPAGQAIIINVAGYTHLAHIRYGSTNGLFSIGAMEDR